MSDNRNIEAVERNEERAACAQAAVEAYAAAKIDNTTDLWDFSAQDAQDRLTDLLADLRHWASQNGLDFEQSLRSSQSHFECELDEEAEDDEGTGDAATGG